LYLLNQSSVYMWRMSTVQQHLGKCVIRWVQLVMTEWNSNFSLLSVNSHYASFAVYGLSPYLTVWNFTTIVCCLSTFAKLCSVTISCHVCLSSPHGTTQLSLDRFKWNLIFEYFLQCLLRIQVSFIWRPKYIYGSILLNSS
jgi:hypothetical protein